MNHTAPQGSILGTGFPVGDIDVKSCEGLLTGVLEAFLLSSNCSFAVAVTRAILAGDHQASVTGNEPDMSPLSRTEALMPLCNWRTSAMNFLGQPNFSIICHSPSLQTVSNAYRPWVKLRDFLHICIYFITYSDTNYLQKEKNIPGR